MPLTRTSVQMVERNRDFMPSSKYPWRLRAGYGCRNQTWRSNAGPRKHLEQSFQVNHQSQAVVVAQHPDAMRDVFRRLLQQVFRTHAIRADDFVRGNSDAHIVMVSIATQRSDHHMFRQKTGATAFGNGNVDERNDGA